jgi:CBS domain-containing protein
MKIKDIAGIKGREVITVKPHATIAEAVKMLVNHKIGAMPVCDFKGVLLGIISERDIIKWLHRGNTDIRVQVKDVMADKVVTADSGDDVETALKLMTEKGIRHLPVMAGTRVVGMVSLRDVADEKLAEHGLQINVLKEYIPEITLKPVAR